MSYERIEAKRLIQRWHDDPVAFTHEALGCVLAPDQEGILRAIAGHKYVAVRSGQKTGKSTSCAIAAIWWVITRPRAYVVFTAPTFPQVEDPLWKELMRVYREARFPLGGEMHVSPSTGWRLPGDRRVFGKTTDKPENMQGTSSPNMLYIVDEASGYPVDLWEPLLGNMAGGGRLLATSNPTQTVGAFYDAFTKNKDGLWFPLQLRSDNTPNYHARRKIIPGLATHEWVEERRQAWGENSAAFQVRVLGEFPSQGDNAVVPLGLVNAAIARLSRTPADGLLNVGVDVARFGDDETVIYPRRGLRVFDPVVVQGFDNVDVAGMALKVARDLRGPHEIPLIKVDEAGNGGGVVDVLSRSDEVDVIGVTSAESAEDPQYAKVRDELWFAVKTFLEQGGALPDDPALVEELVAPTYSFDTKLRQRVESKDEMKRKLGRSPDRADALALSIYEPSIDLSVGGARTQRWRR